MGTKITIPKSIEEAFNYNKKKCKGKCRCLYTDSYLSDARDMNFYQKLNGFERLNILNERATTKTVHVSLNFSPSEKPSDNKLLEIASMYMEKNRFWRATIYYLQT